MAGTVAGGKKAAAKNLQNTAISDESAVETATREALRPTRSWRELLVLGGGGSAAADQKK